MFDRNVGYKNKFKKKWSIKAIKVVNLKNFNNWIKRLVLLYLYIKIIIFSILYEYYCTIFILTYLRKYTKI